MLRIPAECEKGHRDRLLPITPDFATFLLTIPEPPSSSTRGPSCLPRNVELMSRSPTAISFGCGMWIPVTPNPCNPPATPGGCPDG